MVVIHFKDFPSLLDVPDKGKNIEQRLYEIRV